jgi:hypothetical protein
VEEKKFGGHGTPSPRDGSQVKDAPIAGIAIALDQGARDDIASLDAGQRPPACASYDEFEPWAEGLWDVDACL